MEESSIDSAHINSVLRKWVHAIEDNDSDFRVRGQALKSKRLERFRIESSDDGGSVRKVIRPWNYSDFLERLSTYSSMKWFAKPAAISALECARCGWTNEGNDMIGCLFCKVQLWHYFDDFNGSRLHALLTTSHETTCGWSENFSPQEFKQFPMTSEEKLREEYSCRYQLNAGTLHFSSMDIEVPPELASMLAEEVDGMSARSFVEKSTLKLSGGDSAFSFSSSAMYLSLCGWSCLDHDDRHSDAITCAICSRVVRKHSKPFNPLLEHKFYCPWAQIDANVADQSTAIDDRDNIPGWKLTLLSILSIDSNGRRAQKRQSFVGRGANYSIIRAPVNNLNPESTETAMSPEGIYKRVRAILDSTVSCMPPTYVPRPADMEVSERVAASGVNTTPGV